MKNVLSRNLINKNFSLIQNNLENDDNFVIDYKRFCGMIDYWKIMLVEKYNAGPGKTIMLEFNLTDAYYYSAVFAVWELGMIMIVDWPHAQNHEDATSYRMTMHGKIDYAIVYHRQTDPTDQQFYSYWDHQRNLLNCKVLITNKDFDNYNIKNHTQFKSIASNILCSERDYAVWTASGGTTGLPKQIKITHKEIYLQAKRLVDHLNFKEGENTLHTNNLHHGASMCYHFLPSFISCHRHYVFNGDDRSESYHQNLNKIVTQRKINKILLYSSNKLLGFLETTPRLNHNLDIITLFYVNKRCVELLHEKNINSIRNVFGDTTIGYGFLVKIVDQSIFPNTYKAECIGPKLDDFFDFKIEDDSLYVLCKGLGENNWKTSHDKFKLIDNKYYFYGRGNNYRICDEWINLSELDAMVNNFFPLDGATAVIDKEEQQLYLSLWRDNSLGEQQFHNWLASKYQHVRVNKVIRTLEYNHYENGRKIDRQKLKNYFRNLNS
jgi:hypothetical protein